MYCSQCGNQINDNEQFCIKCGNNVGDTINNLKQDDVLQQNKLKKVKRNYKGSLNLTIIFGIIMAIIFLALLIIVLVNRKPIINLNDYVEVEVSGYDTLGTANIVFDYDKFEKEYGDIIVLDKKIKEEQVEFKIIDNYRKIASLLGNNVSDAKLLLMIFESNCNLDKSINLCNGDNINLIWDTEMENANDLAIYFDVKVKCEDISVDVEGLHEITIIDPFKDLEVSFSGVEPDGNVNIVNNSDKKELQNLYYKVNANYGLSNKDTVVVSVSKGVFGYNEEQFVNQYGAILSPTEKEYTVEGLSYYVEEAKEIPDSVIENMKSQAEDIFKAECATFYEDNVVINSMSYMGNYLLHNKEYGHGTGQNKLYLVYKVQASWQDEDYRGNECIGDLEYYYAVPFKDIVINGEGIIEVNLNDSQRLGDTFYYNFAKRKYENSGASWQGRNFFGYETLDKLVEKRISPSLQYYEVEENISEIKTDFQSNDTTTPQGTLEEWKINHLMRLKEYMSGDYYIPGVYEGMNYSSNGNNYFALVDLNNDECYELLISAEGDANAVLNNATVFTSKDNWEEARCENGTICWYDKQSEVIANCIGGIGEIITLYSFDGEELNVNMQYEYDEFENQYFVINEKKSEISEEEYYKVKAENGLIDENAIVGYPLDMENITKVFGVDITVRGSEWIIN